jgi:hypothetical protein
VKSETGRPDLAKELNHLKDFQRASVDVVFQRMYESADPTRRFLVADEVGLGKTLVARGVIAKAIDHLWEKVERIDVIYLCSNSDIARQNVARLTPHGISGVSVATRITLLPLETTQLNKHKVNVVALTPGTSLDLKGNLGLSKERALLLYMVAPHWGLERTGASRMFAGYAALQKFKNRVRDFASYNTVDPDLHAGFLKALDDYCAAEVRRGAKPLRARLTELVSVFQDERKQPAKLLAERTTIIGELRQILARSCIQALQPDLIVLDEFQRFKELLDGEGPAGEMAQALFKFEDESSAARVLLLSATPYKMYTVQDDAGGEDHYQDFLRTIRFLYSDSPASADQLGDLLKRYRNELFRVGQNGTGALAGIKTEIEVLLRRVMVRTERLAVTPDRSGMLVEKQVGNMSVGALDVANYRRMQGVAKVADHADTMEYWKASPWLLNFMDDYRLRKDVQKQIDEPHQPAKFVDAIKAALPTLLSFDDVAAFKRLDPGHGRMRWLTQHMLDDGLWRMLWLKPTMPYYQLEAPFDGDTQSTKALLFSAWRVVPRVVAAMLSYEAERRMYRALEGEDASLIDATERLGDLLNVSRREGRAAGLTVLTLLYPSVWLARECDPLRIAADLARSSGSTATLDQVLREAESRIATALTKITTGASKRLTPDESWYWAAPILLDRSLLGRDSWMDSDLAEFWGADQKSREDSSDDDDAEEGEAVELSDRRAFDDFVARARKVAGGERPAGVPPKDLIEMLALAAVAAPATAALRALSRVTGDASMNSAAAREGAARIGAGFRTLFNQSDSTAVIRATARDKGKKDDYWKECLQYCAGGGLQAVLDEYAHLLIGEAGVIGKPADEVCATLAEYMAGAAGLHRATVGAHKVTVDTRVRSETARLRSRFALRFGEERADAEGEKVRADDVRRAFNSPFWPFVLATTSVGQEGLDFHQYCHRVIHWNLPPNPVDLEQREGRVHRFKGHAVRKNVAKRHPTSWMDGTTEPWESVFEAARRARAREENDLVPYWVYPLTDGAAIERYVPNYPLSRDVERFKALRESLALYRMVFGQPRQEELLAYLARIVPVGDIPTLAAQLSIRLSPDAGR